MTRLNTKEITFLVESGIKLESIPYVEYLLSNWKRLKHLELESLPDYLWWNKKNNKPDPSIYTKAFYS